MAKAKCPNCGTEYDTTGIATICSHCFQQLPVTPPMPPSPPPKPAVPTPSAQRRPCVKCGEPLYPTETTCWKCGTAQGVRPASVSVPGAVMPGYTPPPPPPTPPPVPPIPTPPPYSSDTYVSVPSPQAQSQATTALVLAIVGILCCNLLCPIALAMGLSAKRQGAQGTATAAIVVGAIGTGFLVLGLLWVIIAGLAEAFEGTGALAP